MWAAFRSNFRPLVCSLFEAVACPMCAQDLAPRAYIITPKKLNAIIVTWSYNNGGVNLDGTVPITGATGTFNTPVFSYYHSFGLFGRSANITAALPYAVGTFQGELEGQHHSVYRSGLMTSLRAFQSIFWAALQCLFAISPGGSRRSCSERV
jgi:hypothetical protein